MREKGGGTLNAGMKVGETFDRRGEIFGVFGTKEGVSLWETLLVRKWALAPG